jgi:hypothetical protein
VGVLAQARHVAHRRVLYRDLDVAGFARRGEGGPVADEPGGLDVPAVGVEVGQVHRDGRAALVLDLDRRVDGVLGQPDAGAANVRRPLGVVEQAVPTGVGPTLGET